MVRLTEEEYERLMGRNTTGPAEIERKRSQPSMNVTESWLYSRYLRPLLDGAVQEVLYEHVRLRLGHRLHYTPDFALVSWGGDLAFVEAKGPRWWEDARVKVKAAAARYPWWPFLAAQITGRRAKRLSKIEHFGGPLWFAWKGDDEHDVQRSD